MPKFSKEEFAKALSQAKDWKEARIEKMKGNETFSELVTKINEAIALEKRGEVDKAIEIYEGVIEKNFEGNHPYDRLAVIYRKRNQLEDEIRVLEKAIWVFENVVFKERPDRIEKLERFKERLEKAKLLLKKRGGEK